MAATPTFFFLDGGGLCTGSYWLQVGQGMIADLLINDLLQVPHVPYEPGRFVVQLDRREKSEL